MTLRERERDLLRRGTQVRRQRSALLPPATAPLRIDQPATPKQLHQDEYDTLSAELERLEAELSDVRRRIANGEQ